MFFKSKTEEIIYIFWDIIGQYVAWVVLVGVIVTYFFFPDLIANLGQIALFWSPLFIIIGALIAGSINTRKQDKKSEEQGVGEYNITVSKWTLYLADLLHYGGTAAILICAFLSKETGVDGIDLIQTLIFYFAASFLKHLFTDKIVK